MSVPSPAPDSPTSGHSAAGSSSRATDPGGGSGAGPGSESGAARGSGLLRWGCGAGLAVLLLAGWYWVLFDWPKLCGDAVADGKVVEVCKPLTLASGQIALVLLTALLLVLPFLSEVQLGTWVTLRRTVAQAQATAFEAQAEAADALRQVSSVISQQKVRQDAQARSRAESSNTIMVFAAEAAAAAGAAAAGGQLPHPPVFPTGPGTALAAAARAGFVGLKENIASVPPGWAVELAGFTFSPDGSLAATMLTADIPGELLARARGYANEPDLVPGEATVDLAADGWLTLALATEPGGGLIGALAVLAIPPVQDSGPLGADPESSAEDFAAEAAVAAATFGALLHLLLGEPARRPGPGPTPPLTPPSPDPSSPAVPTWEVS